jgi:hypothetical protein
MRKILRSLKPERFEDIIALVALYRPGPLGSGMVDSFIAGKHGTKKVKYMHPLLKEILEETYGVILYQEQVMQIFRDLADYSLARADLVRRAMSKKKHDVMRSEEKHFVSMILAFFAAADGIVLEVSLNTVKVQNWDNTISTIPTYAMVSESFSNWRGMQDSGGRRIKRSIILDMKSIKFCSDELIEKLSHYQILNDYLTTKTKEINEFNSKLNGDNAIQFNGQKLTNVGVFRKYLEEYLHNNNNINKDMTFLIRQLASTPEGLPMEIYVFSKIKAWVEFEAVQSDIFDHLLAVIPEFELSVFQNPTGDDFHKLLGK